MERQNDMTGIVTRATGSWYDVGVGDAVLRCRMRGRIRLKGVRSTNPVVVGDCVRIAEEAGGSYVITDICPRRNYVIRRASNLSKESHIIAANVDCAILVATLFSPATPLEFVDRFLVACESFGIPVTILLAKIDLAADAMEAVEEFEATYRAAGYDVMRISALYGTGVDAVGELLRGKTALVAGNSGVGKSTLISALCPSARVRTGEISQSHHKGRHTTTFSTMYALDGGGRIIDTPGIKGFGLIDIDAGEVCRYFPEMMRLAPRCRYYNCTHTHEPDCAVAEAVRRGEVAWSRYESYLKILDEDDKYRK